MAEGGSIALNRVGGAAAQAANGEIPQMAKQVDELGENVRQLFLEFLQRYIIKFVQIISSHEMNIIMK